MNLNTLIIAGNLTRDPEIRYTTTGTAIAKVSVAINRTWKDAEGKKAEEVTFVECDAFGTTAENIGKYFKKGKAIAIEGRLKLDQWEDKKSREKRSRLGVVIERFQFVGSKED